MPAIRPGRCPDCGYRLYGLPPPHRCPECGFPYDEHTRVWRPRRPWKVYIYVVGVPVLWLSALVNGVAQSYMLSAGPPEPLRYVAVVLNWSAVVGVPIFAIWRAFRSNRRGRFAAITPEGVRVRTRDFDADLPWGDIVEVIPKRAGDPSIVTRDGKTYAIHFIFDDPHDVARFCRAATSAKQRYTFPHAPGVP